MMHVVSVSLLSSHCCKAHRLRKNKVTSELARGNRLGKRWGPEGKRVRWVEGVRCTAKVSVQQSSRC